MPAANVATTIFRCKTPGHRILEQYERAEAAAIAEAQAGDGDLTRAHRELAQTHLAMLAVRTDPLAMMMLAALLWSQWSTPTPPETDDPTDWRAL